MIVAIAMVVGVVVDPVTVPTKRSAENGNAKQKKKLKNHHRASRKNNGVESLISTSSVINTVSEI